jgi:hypothetical protein
MSETEIDWKEIETKLAAQARKGLATFAKEHPDEIFYGLIFSIEPFDGVSVSMMLNTLEHLEAEAGENASEPTYRWLPGGFEHDVSVTENIAGWEKIDEAIVAATEADMEDDRADDDGLWQTTSQLVEAVCRIALQLESEGAYQVLKRTPDFDIAVSPDASEPGDLSLERFQAFRRRMSKKN